MEPLYIQAVRSKKCAFYDRTEMGVGTTVNGPTSFWNKAGTNVIRMGG
jgi:hypothetical protein